MSIETPVPIAPYSEWKPAEYLREYYGEVMPDEHFAMQFLVEALKRLEPVAIALEFGCGPTVHHSLPMAVLADEIHLAEYLEPNRREIEKWVENAPDAFDWSHFGRETLELEGNASPSDEEIAAREALLRQKVTHIWPGDAFDTNPLGEEKRGFYPLVAAHYCAEGCTTQKSEWSDCMTNICSMVARGGTLILSCCSSAGAYAVGDLYFPCAGVDETDVLASLRANGFGDIDLRVRQVPAQTEQGFSSVIFASAVKSRR